MEETQDPLGVELADLVHDEAIVLPRAQVLAPSTFYVLEADRGPWLGPVGIYELELGMY
jgi:hypothetical protein